MMIIEKQNCIFRKKLMNKKKKEKEKDNIRKKKEKEKDNIRKE
jgi:hypothetical protein